MERNQSSRFTFDCFRVGTAEGLDRSSIEWVSVSHEEAGAFAARAGSACNRDFLGSVVDGTGTDKSLDGYRPLGGSRPRL